ncbi:MAG: sporulation transcriptional regulator SpoIIID [Ruminococcus sp.]|nr:sporulation transcriptional regulator SpoIIID [Ruminococcus sp.]
MKIPPAQRAVTLGRYILENRTTVRAAAKQFGISKSTVHKDVSERLKKEDPDITLGAEERQIGGLGIFLVKKNMDAVSYRYEDGKNIFTMQKAIA